MPGTPERTCRCGHTQDWHASYREHCTHPGCRCLAMEAEKENHR